MASAEGSFRISPGPINSEAGPQFLPSSKTCIDHVDISGSAHSRSMLQNPVTARWIVLLTPITGVLSPPGV